MSDAMVGKGRSKKKILIKRSSFSKISVSNMLPTVSLKLLFLLYKLLQNTICTVYVNNAIIMITYVLQSSVNGTLPVSMVTLTYFLRHPHTELFLCNCEANLSLVCLKIPNMLTNINVKSCH